MIFKEYLLDQFNIDVNNINEKKDFINACLKQCDFKYSGQSSDYDIDPNSKSGEEYDAAFDTECLYISSQALKHNFEWDNKSYQIISLSQRLVGRLLLSGTKGKALDPDVIFEAEITLDEWVDDENMSRQTLKLRCNAQQQACTLNFKF